MTLKQAVEQHQDATLEVDISGVGIRRLTAKHHANGVAGPNSFITEKLVGPDDWRTVDSFIFRDYEGLKPSLNASSTLCHVLRSHSWKPAN